MTINVDISRILVTCNTRGLCKHARVLFFLYLIFFFLSICNALCLWVGLQNFNYQLSSRHHFTVSLCLLSLLMFLTSVFADYFPPPEIVEDRGLARPVVAGIVATICFLAAAILFSTMAACFVNKQRRRKLKRKRGWWLDCSSGSPRFIANSVLWNPELSSKRVLWDPASLKMMYLSLQSHMIPT